VRKCSVKRVELVSLGALVKRDGWHNNGYIFTDGYYVRAQPLPSCSDGQRCEIV
jgi:hypothetical protein